METPEVSHSFKTLRYDLARALIAPLRALRVKLRAKLVPLRSGPTT